jgi:hypothetical protein
LEEIAMREEEWESGEENIDDTGRNPTQQRLDEELETGGGEADVVPTPHEGEEGQDVV